DEQVGGALVVAEARLERRPAEDARNIQRARTGRPERSGHGGRLRAVLQPDQGGVVRGDLGDVGARRRDAGGTVDRRLEGRGHDATGSTSFSATLTAWKFIPKSAGTPTC